MRLALHAIDTSDKLPKIADAIESFPGDTIIPEFNVHSLGVADREGTVLDEWKYITSERSTLEKHLEALIQARVKEIIVQLKLGVDKAMAQDVIQKVQDLFTGKITISSFWNKHLREARRIDSDITTQKLLFTVPRAQVPMLKIALSCGLIVPEITSEVVTWTGVSAAHNIAMAEVLGEEGIEFFAGGIKTAGQLVDLRVAHSQPVYISGGYLDSSIGTYFESPAL